MFGVVKQLPCLNPFSRWCCKCNVKDWSVWAHVAQSKPYQRFVQHWAVRGHRMLALLHHDHLSAVVRAVREAVHRRALGAGADGHGRQRVGALHAVHRTRPQHVLLHVLQTPEGIKHKWDGAQLEITSATEHDVCFIDTTKTDHMMLFL